MRSQQPNLLPCSRYSVLDTSTSHPSSALPAIVSPWMWALHCYLLIKVSPWPQLPAYLSLVGRFYIYVFSIFKMLLALGKKLGIHWGYSGEGYVRSGPRRRWKMQEVQKVSAVTRAELSTSPIPWVHRESLKGPWDGPWMPSLPKPRIWTNIWQKHKASIWT